MLINITVYAHWRSPDQCQWHDTDLDEERGHPLIGVVVTRDRVDHANGIDEPWDALQHAHWVRVVQRVTELLQCIQELDIVLGLIGIVSDASVQLLPSLETLQSTIIDQSVIYHKNVVVRQLIKFSNYFDGLWFGSTETPENSLDLWSLNLVQQEVEFGVALLPVVQFGPGPDVVCFSSHLLTLSEHLENKELCYSGWSWVPQMHYRRSWPVQSAWSTPGSSLQCTWVPLCC